MSVAKVLELSSGSPKGFEDAIQRGLERARQTVDDIQGAWIKDQKVLFKDGQVHEFRVDMKVTFVLKDE